MQFLIDHLIAVVVGSVLLGGLLVLQLRGNDAAVAATAQYRSQAMTAGFATTLEREVENMRSRTETENAFRASALPSLGTGEAYRFRLRTADDGEGGVYTRLFSFPTLSDPDGLGTSSIIIVSYLVEPTGETTFVDGRDRVLYQITRHEFARGGPVVWTDVVDGVVDFDVTMFPADGGPEGERQNVGADMATAETPPRIQIEIRTAHSFGVSRRGQVATSTRHARSIRIPAASARAHEAVPDPATPGGIPLFPGDPGAGPAVAESASPGNSGGTDTPGNSGNGNSGNGSGNSDNGNGNSDNGSGNSGNGSGNSDNGNGNSDNGNGNSDNGNGNGNSDNGNGNSGNGNGNSDNGNGNGNSGNGSGNSGNGNGNSGNGNGSPGSEADEIVIVCHVSWFSRRTLRGTRAELDAHFSHYFDYSGECR